ncbi:hypothetical protein SAMN05421640_3385 [Ekhidna lutea]|uniref:Outer membrane protein beta-barrel domain-containing protein n=1 Tax=Ekhidna lutea TaxID=447679 RepID=A0A239LM37_EKHLU|nr:hypothetical protein [Ekhidna lutea]SNT31636.1 hypothetical protein SAMN05421640_3385 [Ekhidna lutea]
MKQIFVLLIAFLSCSTLSSQNKYYIKAYHNSDFYQRAENIYNYETQERLTTKHSISNFSRVSIALSIKNNKDWYHEMELSYASESQPFQHESRVSENEKRSLLYFSIHYEIYKELWTNDRLKLLSGIGVNIYKSKAERIVERQQIPIKDEYLGATINFVPRITYKVTSRIGLDLNTKLGLLDFHSYESTVYIGQIPQEQQKWVDRTDSDLLPFSYVVRFGLSYLM